MFEYVMSWVMTNWKIYKLDIVCQGEKTKTNSIEMNWCIWYMIHNVKFYVIKMFHNWTHLVLHIPMFHISCDINFSHLLQVILDLKDAREGIACQ